jgi:hypothetical protein
LHSTPAPFKIQNTVDKDLMTKLRIEHGKLNAATAESLLFHDQRFLQLHSVVEHSLLLDKLTIAQGLGAQFRQQIV